MTWLLLILAWVGSDDTIMSPELLWKLGRVSAPKVSPDGKRILFEVTSYDLAKDAGNSDLFLMPAQGGPVRRLTTHEKNDGGALWSPDGKRIGFLSNRSGTYQVYVIDPDGGEPTALTDVKDGVANFLWSPDGKNISFTAEVRLDKEIKDLYPDLPKANAKIIDELMYRHWNFWYEGKYSHLFVQPVAGGQPVDLMKDLRVQTPLVPFGGVSEIAWSPDGAELCYTAKVVPKPAESTDSNLFVVAAAGGPAVNITAGMPGFDRNPLYSPDGKWIAFHSMKRAGFEADKERLMLFDRQTKSIRDLSEKFEHWVGDFCWAPDSKSLFFVAAVKGTTQLFRIDLDGKTTQLTKGRHDLAAPAVAPDGKTIYAQLSTFERPFEIVSVSADGGEPKFLTHVNDEIYARLKLPQVEERWITASDGAKVHCWVVYPPDFDKAKKYPMLTYCQGGPQSPITQFFSARWNFHLMAAKGYIVLAVNRRGLPSFGQDWNDAISRDWGGQAMQDYLAATDAMFKEPFVDRKHTAAIGASFGGYSVYWLMGHDREDRFCAMIAHCGVFNLESMYGSTEELWFVNWDLGGPYWSSPEIRKDYERFSPHRFVQNWDTPLLVIHGEKDFRVPVSEGMQAFTAAQLKGIPSRFLYFPEEGHWISKPQNSVLWQRVFFDWLDRFCKPSPQETERNSPGGSPR